MTDYRIGNIREELEKISKLILDNSSDTYIAYHIGKLTERVRIWHINDCYDRKHEDE